MDRDLLIKVLGMLGSEHDHEVVVAARKAEAMVREAGLSWPVVVACPSTDETRATMLAVSRSISRLARHDQVAFLELRERYFASGSLNDPDQRRLAFYRDLADPPRPPDGDIPF